MTSLAGRCALVSAVAGVVLLASGCGGAQSAAGSSPWMRARRTCLVLSVGGPKGLAELGAIEALRAHHVHIDCVAGNSMGSLVGVIYADAPGQDTTARTREFLKQYVAATESEAGGRALFVGLLGFLLAGPMGALAGGAVGLGSTDTLDHDRTVDVLRHYLTHTDIESMPVPFMTSYETVVHQSVHLAIARRGDAAKAVGWSIANPFIFKELRIQAIHGFDPGTDRVAAVPVDDACRAFPGSRIIAINVTGRPIYSARDTRCPVMEVRVDVGSVNVRSLMTLGPEFERVVALGRRATERRLAQVRPWQK